MPTRAANIEQNHVLMVANPRSGAGPSGELVRNVADLLAQSGFQVEVLTSLESMTSAAKQLYSAGCLRAVVAAGGDGTVAEILNRTEPGIPLAVFPLGTANLLAKYLGISANPAAFAEIIATGCVCRFDAARANGRIFFLMAGVGFDADVVRRVHEARQGHIRYWTYAKPTFAALRSYEYPMLRIHGVPATNSRTSAFEARWAFVVNLPCYAGGLQFAPQAVATDGLLDVCTFSQGRLWHSLRYLAMVMMRRHPHIADCSIHQACSLRIESDAPVPYQLDGDPGGMLPLEIETLPGRLTLLVPRRVAAERGWSAALTQPFSSPIQG